MSVVLLAEGPTFSGGKVSIPISRVDKRGTVVETAVLEGYGAGVSFWLAAEIPVNFSFSTPAPGGGTYILVECAARDNVLRVPCSFDGDNPRQASPTLRSAMAVADARFSTPSLL